jgi:hypothetical protein
MFSHVFEYFAQKFLYGLKQGLRIRSDICCCLPVVSSPPLADVHPCNHAKSGCLVHDANLARPSELLFSLARLQ